MVGRPVAAEHALGSGANARAIAYLELRVDERQTLFGVGIDANIVAASFKAVASALTRARITDQDSLQESPQSQAAEPRPAVCA